MMVDKARPSSITPVARSIAPLASRGITTSTATAIIVTVRVTMTMRR